MALIGAASVAKFWSVIVTCVCAMTAKEGAFQHQKWTIKSLKALAVLMIFQTFRR